MIDTTKTYWGHNGKHQEASVRLGKMVPTSGSMTENSPIEFFRIISNSYYDLYNNGAGNTEVRGEELQDMLQTLSIKRVLSDDPKVVKALKEARDFVNAYLDAYEAGGEWVGDEDEDGDDEWMEPDYPSVEPLYEAYEVLTDAIIELCLSVDDPSQPVTERLC